MVDVDGESSVYSLPEPHQRGNVIINTGVFFLLVFAFVDYFTPKIHFFFASMIELGRVQKKGLCLKNKVGGLVSNLLYVNVFDNQPTQKRSNQRQGLKKK